MNFKIIKGDITTLSVDAIVNAANSSLLGGGGVDGAIHRAAGRELYNECKTLGGCKTGEAKITKGYNLPSKYVIHTVGPIYYEHSEIENITLLSNCYKNSIDIANKYNMNSLAFPSIATGVYGFPKELAAKTAIEALTNMSQSSVEEVIFVCFDEETYGIYKRLLHL